MMRLTSALGQEFVLEFTVKDLGGTILGLEGLRNERGTLLNQRKYIIDLLQHTRLSDNADQKSHLSPLMTNYPQRMEQSCKMQSNIKD